LVAKRYVPGRGDLIWLLFDPQAGHEQAGRRPALVLTPSKYNQLTSLAVCCPITSQIKGYPFEVAVRARKVAGVILADQVKSLDWRIREATFIERLPAATMQEVQQKLFVLLQG
jgi:mRNA interferase MazF